MGIQAKAVAAVVATRPDLDQRRLVRSTATATPVGHGKKTGGLWADTVLHGGTLYAVEVQPSSDNWHGAYPEVYAVSLPSGEVVRAEWVSQCLMPYDRRGGSFWPVS